MPKCASQCVGAVFLDTTPSFNAGPNVDASSLSMGLSGAYILLYLSFWDLTEYWPQILLSFIQKKGRGNMVIFILLFFLKVKRT